MEAVFEKEDEGLFTARGLGVTVMLHRISRNRMRGKFRVACSILVQYGTDHIGQKGIHNAVGDMMANCGLTDLRREGEEALKGLNLENYQRYTFNMYGGETKEVTLRFRNNMMNTVIDKFGRQNYAIPVDKDHFEVTVTVAVSPQFYGWVFGLKNYVTIVSPPDVVKGMAKHVEAVGKRYGLKLEKEK